MFNRYCLKILLAGILFSIFTVTSFAEDTEYYNNCRLGNYNKDYYNAAVIDLPSIINIDSAEFYFFLGREYYKEGKYSEALTVLNKGLALGKYQCELYTVRGNVYYKMGNTDNAMSDFKTAIIYFDEAVLQYYNPYFNLGNIYFDLGDYQTAIGYYNDAVRVQPIAGDAYYARGLCYEALGNNDQAQADFQMAKYLGYTAGVTAE